MTNKTILVLTITAAFVAGTITTGTVAFAAPGGQGNEAIVNVLMEIRDAIIGIDTTVNIDPTPVTLNVDPASVNVNVDPTPVTNQVNVEPTPVNVNISPSESILPIMQMEITPVITSQQGPVLNLDFTCGPDERPDVCPANFLVYGGGDTLCAITQRYPSQSVTDLWLLFGENITVQHFGEFCLNLPNEELLEISLVTGEDTLFKQGDILVLNRFGTEWVEVFRQQT